MLSIYGTKKFGKIDFIELEEEVDPAFAWYVDVFYLEKKKCLIFCNGATKFSFVILSYTKKEYPDFEKMFFDEFFRICKCYGLRVDKYLNHVKGVCRDTKVNRSALAHISQKKVELAYYSHEGVQDQSDCQIGITQNMNDFIVSYPGEQGYSKPIEKFTALIDSL